MSIMNYNYLCQCVYNIVTFSVCLTKQLPEYPFWSHCKMICSRLFTWFASVCLYVVFFYLNFCVTGHMFGNCSNIDPIEQIRYWPDWIDPPEMRFVCHWYKLIGIGRLFLMQDTILIICWFSAGSYHNDMTLSCLS